MPWQVHFRVKRGSRPITFRVGISGRESGKSGGKEMKEKTKPPPAKPAYGAPTNGPPAPIMAWGEILGCHVRGTEVGSQRVGMEAGRVLRRSTPREVTRGGGGGGSGCGGMADEATKEEERFLSSQADRSQERRERKIRPASLEMTACRADGAFVRGAAGGGT